MVNCKLDSRLCTQNDGALRGEDAAIAVRDRRVGVFHLALAANLPTIAGLGLLATTTIGLGLLASAPPWYALFLPLTMTAMILTLAYNPQFALLLSVSLALAALAFLAICMIVKVLG